MSDCIEWEHATNDKGYGQYQKRYTHRRAWELMRGPIPPNMLVCHRCDNRRCFNIEHLFLGSPKDNSRDMVQKYRNQFGAERVNAKLNDAEANEIRVAWQMGARNSVLAHLFRVSPQSICDITHGRNWVSQ